MRQPVSMRFCGLFFLLSSARTSPLRLPYYGNRVVFACVERFLHTLSAYEVRSAVLETKLPDENRGFQGYLPGHLRPTSYAVRKDNRHLGDVKSSQVAKIVNFNLEAIAVSFYVAEIYGLQNLSAETLKATGAILDW